MAWEEELKMERGAAWREGYIGYKPPQAGSQVGGRPGGRAGGRVAGKGARHDMGRPHNARAHRDGLPRGGVVHGEALQGLVQRRVAGLQGDVAVVRGARDFRPAAGFPAWPDMGWNSVGSVADGQPRGEPKVYCTHAHGQAMVWS